MIANPLKTVCAAVIGFLIINVYLRRRDNKAIVLKVLGNVATQFTQKYGKVPVLFIDGVDLLAKRDPVLCEALITNAKLLANAKQLQLVLISSEGAIIPFLRRCSAMNRALVYEIRDLDDEQARKYLREMGISGSRANKIVNCIGSRLVYLESCVILNRHWEDDDVCNNIKFSRMLSYQKAIILKLRPESKEIIKALSMSTGSISFSQLLKDVKSESRMDEAIKIMVDVNILRYDEEGNIKFHGKMQEDELSQLTDDDKPWWWW